MQKYTFLICGCVLGLGIGFYSFLIALSKSIKKSLFFIKREIGDRSKQKLILEQLIEFLEFHSHVKQLCEEKSSENSELNAK